MITLTDSAGRPLTTAEHIAHLQGHIEWCEQRLADGKFRSESGRAFIKKEIEKNRGSIAELEKMLPAGDRATSQQEPQVTNPQGASEVQHKTLADLNAKPFIQDGWGYTLRHEYRVGRIGAMQTGIKYHVVSVDIVQEVLDPSKKLKVGAIFRTMALCNYGGAATPMSGMDTDSVTCEKCQRWLKSK